MLLLLLLAMGCSEPVDPPPHCGSDDLPNAPAPLDHEGGKLVAVDLAWVDAVATVDATVQDLRVEAQAGFTMSATEGRPVFQLAHDAAVRLDGADVDVETVVVSDPPRTLKVLPEILGACSEHTLEVVHTIRPADVDQTRLPRLQFSNGAAWWSSAQEDGVPDEMLELWLPSNLLFDRFDLTLEVDVEANTEHRFVANGAVIEEGNNRWTASWSGKQPHGPFWVLSEAEGLIERRRTVDLDSGDVEVHLLAFEEDAGVDLDSSADVAEAALRQYDARLGPYLHGDAYLAWMRSDLGVSMEYDGATLSEPGALEHEIAHSWWGRGVAPVSDHHGWIDEGMAFWGTGDDPFAPTRVEAGVRGARLLNGEDGWSGAGLSLGDYLQGALVFGGIAHVVGVEALLEELRSFSAAIAPGPTSTDALERHLYCAFEQQYVIDVFHNKVRGLDGFAEVPRPEFCE